SSGLPVSFAVASGPGTIVGGTNLSFTATGTVLVVASQGGDAIYNPAPNVTNSVSVGRIGQMITFLPIASQPVTGRVGLAATASSGLPVSFAVASGPGVISGGMNLTFTATGTVRVVASQGGDATYNPAPNTTNAVAVDRVSQTITFPTIPAQVVTSQVGLAVTASSGLPVSFAVASGPGTIVGGTKLAFSATGIVCVVASQSGNSMWEAAASVTNAVSVMNPPAGEIWLVQTNVVVNEDVVNVELRVVRTNGNYGVVSVDYTNRPVTASAGLDYGVVAGRLTWADGDASDKIITIPVVDDSVDEPDEVFEVVLTNAVGTVILGTNVASVTIVDNDDPPAGVIQFAVTSTEVGEAGGSVTLNVVRTGGSYGVASVEYGSEDGTATAGLDYEDIRGVLNWPDGDTSERIITIKISDDLMDEPNETFSVKLWNAVGVELGNRDTAAVTIVDNDNNPEPGTVQFSPSSYSVNEDAGTVTLTVTRTGGSFGSASVDYTTSDGTASTGSDYTSRSGSLSWSDGDTSSKTITVSITDDILDENNETFTVTLSNAVGAGLGSPSSATVMIVDNNEYAEADLEVSDLKFEPVNLWAGDHPAMISFDLVNEGPEDIVSPETQLEINFYLSSNTTFGDEDDIAIGTTTEDITLSAGTQTTIRDPGRAHNTDVTIPEGTSGDYYVFVSVGYVSPSHWVDPDGAYAMRDGPINVRIHPVVNDYDGDEVSDMMVYDEASGKWAIRLSESGEWVQFVFGGPGYETVPGDYDGDCKVDPAIHQRKGYQWYIMLSGMEYAAISFDFGGEGETKGAVGDYNGDGRADPGLYEEGSGRWYVLLPNTEHGNYEVASVVFGGLGYTPVAGDYDGDGCTDPAVYEEATGEWRVMLSDKGYRVVAMVLGGPGYRAVVGDYDGDGKSDPAIVSASGGWYYRLSSHGYSLSGPDAFGVTGKPVVGDFDGDGKADPAIMDSSGNWYFWLSGSFYTRDGPYALILP
ncbi:MAG: hypothetical protein KKF10_02525, partial [Verrucomicrobia bacterium]|nr:hypothetical protein [Verrucomicrobiota bacterium]